MSSADDLRSAIAETGIVMNGVKYAECGGDLADEIMAVLRDPKHLRAILDATGADIDAIYKALGLTVRRMVMPSPGGVTGGAYGIVDFINENPQARVDFVVRPGAAVKEGTDA